MNDLTAAEVRGDRQGKVGAIIGLLLFLLLLIIPVFFTTLPKPGQPGILVNLGMIDMGEGDRNAPPPARTQPTPPPLREVEPTPATPPPPPPPAAEPEPEPVPVQRDVVVTETPQEIAIRKQKAKEEARKKAEADQRRREQDRINQQKETDRRQREAAAREQRRQQELIEERQRKAAAEEAARKQAAADARAAKQAQEAEAAARVEGALGGSGSGRGNTGTPGNQGVQNGDPNADALKGISTSNGMVSGGLGGRGVTSNPLVKENTQQTGTVVVRVCVGPDGNVVSAQRQQGGTTATDAQLLRSAEQNAAKWRFKPDPTAPARQCGEITYRFTVK